MEKLEKRGEYIGTIKLRGKEYNIYEIGIVKLRQEHTVYKVGKNFVIRYTHRIGEMLETYETVMKINKVERFLNIFRDIFGNKKFTIEEAKKMIEKTHRYEKYLDTYRGKKRKYEVENILICIVAVGSGEVEKHGRGWVFKIY